MPPSSDTLRTAAGWVSSWAFEPHAEQGDCTGTIRLTAPTTPHSEMPDAAPRPNRCVYGHSPCRRRNGCMHIVKHTFGSVVADLLGPGPNAKLDVARPMLLSSLSATAADAAAAERASRAAAVGSRCASGSFATLSRTHGRRL